MPAVDLMRPYVPGWGLSRAADRIQGQPGKMRKGRQRLGRPGDHPESPAMPMRGKYIDSQRTQF